MFGELERFLDFGFGNGEHYLFVFHFEKAEVEFIVNLLMIFVEQITLEI